MRPLPRSTKIQARFQENFPRPAPCPNSSRCVILVCDAFLDFHSCLMGDEPAKTACYRDSRNVCEQVGLPRAGDVL